MNEEESVYVHLFRDGTEVLLNIVDENMSILITFRNDDQCRKVLTDLNNQFEKIRNNPPKHDK